VRIARKGIVISK